MAGSALQHGRLDEGEGGGDEEGKEMEMEEEMGMEMEGDGTINLNGSAGGLIVMSPRDPDSDNLHNPTSLHLYRRRRPIQFVLPTLSSLLSFPIRNPPPPCPGGETMGCGCAAWLCRVGYVTMNDYEYEFNGFNDGWQEVVSRLNDG